MHFCKVSQASQSHIVRSEQALVLRARDLVHATFQQAIEPFVQLRKRERPASHLCLQTSMQGAIGRLWLIQLKSPVWRKESDATMHPLLHGRSTPGARVRSLYGHP